jgi:hypothetical protein
MLYYVLLRFFEVRILQIVTPIGKWRRTRVPMGFIGSTDWAQVTMEEIFQDVLDEVELYIDDIRLFHTKWKDHITMVDLVLTRLEENGFTVNPLKCEWGVQETNWLGHWLTPNGPKPWRKKNRAYPCSRTPNQSKAAPRVHWFC